MSVITCLPNSTPASANTPSTRPSLTSTWPYLLRLTAPTSALGNLWQMFEATATMPGAPSVIIAGVSTKAPPEPMKPDTMPPTKPTRISRIAVSGVISMKSISSMACSSCHYFLALRSDHVPEQAGEQAVRVGQGEGQGNRRQHVPPPAFDEGAVLGRAAFGCGLV